MKYFTNFIQRLALNGTKQFAYTQHVRIHSTIHGSPASAASLFVGLRHAHTMPKPLEISSSELVNAQINALEEKRKLLEKKLEKNQRALAKAHLSAARLTHYEGNDEQATASAKKALEIDPSFKEAQTFIDSIDFEETMRFGNVTNYTISQD
jgi:tetratricopeptide (TPR) repeat protein